MVLPRFLAPNDRGRLALSLHNIDGQAGDYRLTLEATGSVSLDRPVAETRRLAADQRELLTWPLVKAGEAGFGKVAVAVAGPGNFAVRREWDIQVRAAQTPSAVDTVSQLDPARELTVDRNVTASFAPGTAQVGVALSRIPGIDVAALLRALDKYPYGCIEQTTSRALPLLYYNDVALLGYGPADPRIGDRVQEAVYRIVDMQLPDGSFGMWGPYSPAAEWLQGYALDFLLRARDQQMAVPAASLQRGLTWLNRTADKLIAQRPGLCLVRAGQGRPRRSRPRPLLPGHERRQDQRRPRLGAARRRAEPCRPSPAAPGWPSPWPARRLDQRDRSDYYGSAAAQPRRPAGAGGRSRRPRGLRRSGERWCGERMVAKVDHTTTQEQAWLVHGGARHGRPAASSPTRSTASSKKATREPVVINPDQAAIARGVRVKNEGDGPVWMQVTARGVPIEPQPAATPGAERRSAVPDARRASRPTCARLRQNERLIVSISGRNLDGGYHEVALLDLLPAGFEIEIGADRARRRSPSPSCRSSPTRASPRRATTASSPRSTSAGGPTARGGIPTRTRSERSTPSMSPTSCAP